MTDKENEMDKNLTKDDLKECLKTWRCDLSLFIRKEEIKQAIRQSRQPKRVSREWVEKKAKELRYSRQEFATEFLTQSLLELLEELDIEVGE